MLKAPLFLAKPSAGVERMATGLGTEPLGVHTGKGTAQALASQRGVTGTQPGHSGETKTGPVLVPE